jgi:hypothetical protein
MALPVSRSMDSEVPLSGSSGSDRRGGKYCIHAFSEQQKVEIVELNIQLDHVQRHHFVALSGNLWYIITASVSIRGSGIG